jgi:hypothetical protein
MGIFRRKKKSRVFPILFGSCLIIVVLLIFGAWYTSKKLSNMSILNTDFVRNTVVKEIGQDKAFLFDLMPAFLGFSKPQTYLVLLLNNTELRPGGGFIGTYATIEVDGGKMDILALDGTENLDRNAPENWKVEPPAPMREYLDVDRWFFRDSNWSPDFRVDAERAMSFYAAEEGIAAGEIDGVIGITPTVLEELLEIVGPVTVEGVEFTSENVVETLEYQVEYAYKDKDIHKYDRKKIIQPLLLQVLEKMKEDILSEYRTYLNVAEALANQKHILFYHTDESVQQILEEEDWAGRVASTDGDYLLWVDANLAALKTDEALQRKLTYEIVRSGDDRYTARTTMEYTHTGNFDWRTSRYITYARVYAPEGSTLIDVEGVLKSGASITTDMVDIGTELGKQLFGTMFSIEPGQVKTLSFTYLLPEKIGQEDEYELLVQKQLGSIEHTLTLDLDFATLLQSAEPPEEEEEWYDGVYRYTTDLKVDREFRVKL